MTAHHAEQVVARIRTIAGRVAPPASDHAVHSAGSGRAEAAIPTTLSAPLSEGALWKSELALLIYLPVVVWTTVGVRPLVAHHLAAPRPSPGDS
jgi:hypothetical protein